MDTSVSKKGKVAGARNFQSVEDVNIAKAYRLITTDASVGVDQDGEAYYTKISDVFHKLMGEGLIQERSVSAIKSRWLNVIQKALLKFSSCLNKALAEYHSGWCIGDYISAAKQIYSGDVKKQFSFELCWMELKDLPKFSIDTEVLSSDMKRALSLNEAVENATTTPGASSNKSLSMARRPDIGKKKAKKLKFGEPCSNLSRDRIFEQIATNSAERTKNQRESFHLKLFMSDPTAPESREFIRLKREEALVEARLQLLQKKQQLAALSPPLPLSFDGDVSEDDE